MLPPYVIADLYTRRWHIETAFCLVKRLLGLSYLWTGSFNGIQLQIWATWLCYAVLLDLADAVAVELLLPTERISVEMLFPGLYHFNHAANQGKATHPVRYFAAPENKDLAIVKALPKAKRKQGLIYLLILLDFCPVALSCYKWVGRLSNLASQLCLHAFSNAFLARLYPFGE